MYRRALAMGMGTHVAELRRRNLAFWFRPSAPILWGNWSEVVPWHLLTWNGHNIFDKIR